MTSTSDYFSRKVSSSRTRPSVFQSPSSAQPSSPHTPLLQRSLSSLYGSPSASFRGDDESVVFEVGSRYMRAGYAGESAPRCTLEFGPEEQRRVGDYRRWMPGFSTTRRKRKRGQDWGQEHELWRIDLRDVDLGLVTDKLERAVREAYSKYLLSDSRPKRIMLTLPSLIPRPLLSALLSTLFAHSQALSITVLPSPLLCCIAAGLRSALVVDIGWAETTVTAMYEYREVHEQRTVRACKMLSGEMGKLLDEEYAKDTEASNAASRVAGSADAVSFEEAEEVLTRMGWCLSREEANTCGTALPTMEDTAESRASSEAIATIPLPAATPPTTLRIPFSHLAEPAERALFAQETPAQYIDDHDQPLPMVAYRVLLSLPIDVRKICMSRIVVTGGGSNLPGVKRRIIHEVEALIAEHGWGPVRSYGTASEKRRAGLRSFNTRGEARDNSQRMGEFSEDPQHHPPNAQSPVPAARQPQEHDPIAEKLHQQALKHIVPDIQGVIRGVETLGAWAGASLVANFRIRGIVEVDKDSFLQHGLAGAKKEKDISVTTAQRQNLATSARPGVAGERSSWTLGIWA